MNVYLMEKKNSKIWNLKVNVFTIMRYDRKKEERKRDNENLTA